MTGSVLEDHETGLLQEILFVTNSTDVAHIVEDNGTTACEQFDYDLDEVRTDSSGHVFYYSRYFGDNGLIHEKDTWRPVDKSLCHYCDQEVPDDLQAELFTDEKFTVVDDVTVGDAR